MKGRTNRFEGLTMLETVIVLVIIGIMMALLTISIQQVRESSRRVMCENNLHQIGIAVSSFVSTTGTFPKLLANRGAKLSEIDQSVFLTLLPELEQATVAEEKNSTHGTEMDLPPKVFRCPSSNDFLGYRFSFGSGLSPMKDLDGIIRIQKGDTSSEITDGLSNTVQVSERISGTGKIGGEGQTRQTAIVVFPILPDADTFLRRCATITNPYNYVAMPGIHWRGHQPVHVGYNHFNAPNSKGWDCQGALSFQLLSARSHHPGGVMALLADGSVRWIESAIDISTWRALGTVAGHEVVPDGG